MGFWGTGPLDGDTPADWFCKLFDDTKLDELVRKALQPDMESMSELDVQHACAEMRAAAWVVERLGYNYVWPIEDEGQKPIVQLALEQLTKMHEVMVSTEGPESEWAEAIQDQIEGLREGLNDEGTVRSYSPGLMERLADHLKEKDDGQ